MPIYLQLGDIKGGATGGHEGWIVVHSLTWGSGRQINTPVGATTDRVSSTPSVSEVVVSKEVDSASTSLFQEHLKKKPEAKEAKIEICDSDASDPYLTYTLKNTLIGNYSVSSGGNRPLETLSLNFTDIEFKHVSKDPTTQQDDPKSATYSLTTGETG